MNPATSILKMRRNFKKKIIRRYSLIKSSTITKLYVFRICWQIKTTILSQKGNPSWAPPNPLSTWTNPVFDLNSFNLTKFSFRPEPAGFRPELLVFDLNQLVFDLTHPATARSEGLSLPRKFKFMGIIQVFVAVLLFPFRTLLWMYNFVRGKVCFTLGVSSQILSSDVVSVLALSEGFRSIAWAE